MPRARDGRVGCHGSPAAAQSFRQVDLAEKQVQGFIAAQKPMTDATEKMQGGPSDKPDPKLQAELEAIAKKQGFKDLAEYDEVAATISMVMAGIDPETKQYIPADVAIRQQIKDIEADKSLPADERKQVLDESTNCSRRRSRSAIRPISTWSRSTTTRSKPCWSSPRRLPPGAGWANMPLMLPTGGLP